MEPSYDPQSPSNNHAGRHLTNVVLNNADSLKRVHELISHLVGKAPENGNEDSIDTVKFSIPPGYEIVDSNHNRFILRKKHNAVTFDKGKDDVATGDFEVNISFTSNEITASIGIPDHAGAGPRPQPGTGT